MSTKINTNAELVAAALKTGATLTVEMDSGTFELSGDDLRHEWEALAPGEAFVILPAVEEPRGFDATLADFHIASNPKRPGAQYAADRLILSDWSEARRRFLPMTPQTVAQNWRTNISGLAYDLREGIVYAERTETNGADVKTRLAALEAVKDYAALLLVALGEKVAA